MNTESMYRIIWAAMVASCLALAGCGGGDPVIEGPLFTTAPTQLTLNAGSSASYKVNGGNLPYTASSGNANVARASVSDGMTLSLTAVGAGTTPITIMDSHGSKLNLDVTVLAQGQGGVAISLTPDALTVGNCTTRIPFLFTGGVPPYTVFTSDNFQVPVSSALELVQGSGRFYFFADVKYAPGATVQGPATLTVLDSQSRTATAKLTTPSPVPPCPSNPLLVVSPESANFRATEILAFQFSGGPSPAIRPRCVYFNGNRNCPIDDPIGIDTSGVVKVASASATTINVQALKAGATLMTVETADDQKASVVINVLPQ